MGNTLTKTTVFKELKMFFNIKVITKKKNKVISTLSLSISRVLSSSSAGCVDLNEAGLF